MQGYQLGYVWNRLFRTLMMYMLFHVPSPLCFGIPSVCVVPEECAVGTIVCDIGPLLKDFGIDIQKFVPTTKEEKDRFPIISVISEAQTFVLVGTQLVTRGRVDRENYLAKKQCRKKHVPYGMEEQPAEDEQANQILCVIVLELAVLRSRDEPQPTFIHLPIQIEDINDNPPRFDQHTSGLWIEVDEDIASDSDAYIATHKPIQVIQSPNGEKHQVREIAVLPLAIDLDYGFNGTVSYSLEGSDANGFQLDDGLSSENSLVLSHNQRTSDVIKRLRLLSILELNHETKLEHRLVLVARDNCEVESARHAAQLPIVVTVREVNEYAPQFDLGISEPNGVDVSRNEFQDTARVHPSVRLEHIENPANDRPPMLVIDVPESIPVGSRIYRVLALDKDTRVSDGTRVKQGIDFSGIEYSLASSTDLKVKRYFRIGAADGWITLIQQLDYEAGPKSFAVPIIATDSGRPARTSTLNLLIRTMDINDEAPIIEIRGIAPLTQSNTAPPNALFGGSVASRFHILSVKENLPQGTFVAKISASDRDKGSAGEVTCHLSEPPDMAMKQNTRLSAQSNSVQNRNVLTDFQLKPAASKELTTKVNSAPSNFGTELNAARGHSADYILVTNKQLDREEQETYLVVIICHDHGAYIDDSSVSQAHKQGWTRRLSSTSMMKIFVLDENDNGPQFITFNQNVQVPENTVQGTRIIQLKTLDKDAPGTASQTVYRFATADDLSNRNNTDCEELKSYFEIEELSGWIRAGKLQLDRESRDVWRIPVVAFDREFPNRTSLAWIHIQVSDVNDNAPRLIGNSTFWIEEEIGRSSSSSNYQSAFFTNRQIFVGHLKAEDADLNDNGRISFLLPYSERVTMNNSAPHLRWVLRPDGTLFVYPGVNFTIDREQQDVYFLPVVLRDHGVNISLSYTTTLTVSILDKNDNPPQFIRPPTTNTFPSVYEHTLGSEVRGSGSNLPKANLRLSEDISPGTVVFTALATDPDDGENGRVRYALETYEGVWQLMNSRSKLSWNYTNTSTYNPYFIIEETSGEIRLNRRLSASDKKRPKRLVIFAEDCGTPPRRNYAFLNVELESEGVHGIPNSRQNGLSTMSTNNNRQIIRNESGQYEEGKSQLDRKPTVDRQSGAPHPSMINKMHRAEASPKDSPASKHTSNAMMLWNSELVTGLGIGLLIVILICLLLLVMYAIHGTKLMPTRLQRPLRGTQEYKLNKVPTTAGSTSNVNTGKVKRVTSRNTRGKVTGMHGAMQCLLGPKEPPIQLANENTISHRAQDLGGTEPSTASLCTTSVIHPTYLRSGSPNSLEYIKHGTTEPDYIPTESTQWLVRTVPYDGLGSQGSSYVYASNVLIDGKRLTNDCSVCMRTQPNSPLNTHYTTISEDILSHELGKRKRVDGYQTLQPDTSFFALHSSTGPPGSHTIQPEKRAHVTFYDSSDFQDTLFKTNSVFNNVPSPFEYTSDSHQHVSAQNLAKTPAHINSERSENDGSNLPHSLEEVRSSTSEKKRPSTTSPCQKPGSQSSFV